VSGRKYTQAVKTQTRQPKGDIHRESRRCGVGVLCGLLAQTPPRTLDTSGSDAITQEKKERGPGQARYTDTSYRIGKNNGKLYPQ